MGIEEGGGRRGGERGVVGEGRGGGARRKAAAKLLSDDVLTSSDAIDAESVQASRRAKIGEKKRAREGVHTVHRASRQNRAGIRSIRIFR